MTGKEKSSDFGQHYLPDKQQISIEDGQRLINQFFNLNPKLVLWMKTRDHEIVAKNSFKE